MTDNAFRPVVERPTERYGSRPPRSGRRTQLLAGLGVLVAALGVWWFWAMVARPSEAVQYATIGFQEVTDRSVDVRFTVEPDGDGPVSCLLWARNLGGEEVGRDRVEVPAGDSSSVELVHTLRTTDRAVSAEVLTCQRVERASGSPG